MSDNFATKDHTHSGMGGGGTDYIDSTWSSVSLMSKTLTEGFDENATASHNGYAFIRVRIDTTGAVSPSKYFIEIKVANMSIGKCGGSYVENSFIAMIPVKKNTIINISSEGTKTHIHESSVSIQLLYKD